MPRNELLACEIRATEVIPGDRMQYEKVSISGGRPKVVEHAVVNAATWFKDGVPTSVDIQLADGHWLEYGLDTTVVVYRTEEMLEEIAEGVFGKQ